MVTREGRRITLQPREFALLAEFTRNPRRVMARTMLPERVWDFDFDPKIEVASAPVVLGGLHDDVAGDGADLRERAEHLGVEVLVRFQVGDLDAQ